MFLFVSDKDGGGDFVFNSIDVRATNGDTPPAVTLAPASTIKEGDTYHSSGSFDDPDAGDSWTATVNYGDGSGVQPWRSIPTRPSPCRIFMPTTAALP